jgi:hypothetical protein
LLLHACLFVASRMPILVLHARPFAAPCMPISYFIQTYHLLLVGILPLDLLLPFHYRHST